MAKKSSKTGTVLRFIGGVNHDRIGGNCSIIEHTADKGETTRVMIDLGVMFTPYKSGFSAALPNIEEYFDRLHPETDDYTTAVKPVSAIFFTHAHQDHIGALIDCQKMGYVLPPIYASRYTRNMIRIGFAQEGLVPPEIETIKHGQEIKVKDNVVVEPFTVSHSILGSMGFHIQTFVKGKPHAGIINNGDFLVEEDMPIGDSFSFAEYESLLQRKLTTHILLDSTSTGSHGKERIGYKQAADNTLAVIEQNPERKIIISPVISSSNPNMSIDCDVARRLGTKICLDGKWLTLSHKAMMMSGYNDFEDVIYKGKLDKYLADNSIKKKYIVCTGAFAQGMEEYEANQSDSMTIPMASATKMALDLHKDLKINHDVLLLERQRIIKDINGETGPKMLQLFASHGAKVVMTPGERKVGNIEEVQMQDSGHVNAEETGRLMDIIQQNAPQAVVIPIHGSPEQSRNTAELAAQHGLTYHLAENMQALQLNNAKTQPIDEDKVFNWIGVKKVYFNPLEPDHSVPLEGKTEYWHIDKWYMPIEKIGEASNVRIYKPGDRDYTVSIGKMFDDGDEDLFMREPMGKKGKTGKQITRKEKGDKRTRAERDAEKREMLRQRKEDKKAKELSRLLKKIGRDKMMD